MEGNMYYDDEIRSGVESLTEEDRLLLIESMFNSIIACLTSLYVSVGHSDREIKMLINEEIGAVKDTIKKQLAKSRPMLDIKFEYDPSIPTDPHFEWEAGYDLGKLIEEVNKSK
jgi:hypothetical protein